MRLTFQSFPATVKATFDCPKCGKTKRTRSFTAECTVNPFNKREDGEMRTPAEVREQSIREAESRRATFLREPLCAACEDALPFAEKRELHRRRKAESQP